eukprot:GHVU01118325.1.p1 GENE.GHVU01118325.1~~GHVU01118325.1.p1  ORF type:complete len:204 (+),score=22.25 GHVU01118325.1:673-1284(+)
MFSSRWYRQQPVVTLVNKSPRVDVDEKICGSGGGKTNDVLISRRQATSSSESASSRPSALPPLFIGQNRGDVRPDCPAEFNTDCVQRFAGIMGRAGHDRGSLSQAADWLDQYESLESSAIQEGAEQESIIDLPKAGARVGRAQETRLKSAAVEPRSNGVRKRRKGHCGHCSKEGHRKDQCPQLRKRFPVLEATELHQWASDSE